ncbi:MAG: TolC family protein [Prevotella sp.]|nr:TolC family protein [Prevotella sp.]
MKKMILTLCGLAALSASAQKKWTLQDCLDYAMQHNLTLKSAVLNKQSATEDRKQSKADLFPSLSASTTHSVGYTPWEESSAIDKGVYSGNYGVNASWTVWNGNRNRNALKQDKLTEQRADLTVQQTANTIQETIATLYVRVLYMSEAIAVNKQSLEASKTNEERGRAMLEVGKMSKADLAQLTAQRATEEYNLVSAESELSNCVLEMKQMLEITDDPTFDVAVPAISDQKALEPIPAKNTVYELALQQRPEIKSGSLAIESSELAVKMAKAGYMPTVKVTGGLGSNTSSMSERTWGVQMKNNFDASVGVGVSVPLFDNRSTKTAVNKAKIQREQAKIELEEEEDDLYATVESLWLDAQTNQQKFRAAQVTVDSEQQSYDLLSEQFQLGLKNIVELLNGKTNLLKAQQNKLQAKYTTILNLQLLRFYQGEEISI